MELTVARFAYSFENFGERSARIALTILRIGRKEIVDYHERHIGILI